VSASGSSEKRRDQAAPGQYTATMAAALFYQKCVLLLIFYFGSITALDRRFSDLKICADKECSSKFLFVVASL
jgi:hypothetical protein